MELAALIISLVSLIGLVVAGLLLRRFLPSYMTEKGKNLASKEDLAHITTLVEGVKSQYAADIERLKAVLLSEGQVVERRRRVYEEMCLALRVFIAGHDSSSEAKDRFHAAYAAAWLWGSDDVITSLNHLIELQVQHAQRGSIDQLRLKGAYTSVVVAMREDVGFAGTSMGQTDYQFVQFEPEKKAQLQPSQSSLP